MKHLLFFSRLLLVLLLIGCGQGERLAEQTETGDSVAVRIQLLSQEIGRDDGNPGLYNYRARLYFIEREFDKALKDINKAISLDDKNPDYFLTLSDIQLFMGQTDNCLAALTRASSLDPENLEARLKLAKLYLILRNYTECKKVLNDLISSDAYNPKAYFLRAVLFLENGDTAMAVSDFMKAVDQDQQYFDAYMQLGELFSIRKDPLAEGYLGNALRIRPDNREALYMLGMYFQSTDQFERALQTYQRLSVVCPDFSNAPYNKGYIYLVYMTDFPRAIEEFTIAIRMDSTYTDAYFNRGYAYELNGQPDLAYEDYMTTLKLDVNNPRAIEGLNRLDQAGFVR